MSPFAANNDELAVLGRHGEFRLVSTTTSPPPQKDSDHALLHLHDARVHR